MRRRSLFAVALFALLLLVADAAEGKLRRRKVLRRVRKEGEGDSGTIGKRTLEVEEEGEQGGNSIIELKKGQKKGPDSQFATCICINFFVGTSLHCFGPSFTKEISFLIQ